MFHLSRLAIVFPFTSLVSVMVVVGVSVLVQCLLGENVTQVTVCKDNSQMSPKCVICKQSKRYCFVKGTMAVVQNT